LSINSENFAQYRNYFETKAFAASNTDAASKALAGLSKLSDQIVL